MQIIPKICEYDYQNVNPIILDQIRKTHKCEVQMLQKDFIDSFENIKKVVDLIGADLDYLVIHLPFYAMYIDFIYCSTYLRNLYKRLVYTVVNYSNKHNIKIDILSHVSPSLDWFIGVGADIFIIDILDMIQDTNVGILIENSIISLNENDDTEYTEEYIFRNIKNSHIKFCLDLCHLQASENVLRKSIDLSPNLVANLKNVHFSMTLDRDGFRNKKVTHGRAHRSTLDIENDLCYLKDKGIDIEKVNIIAEINEDNYDSRPDLVKEILLFNDIYM